METKPKLLSRGWTITSSNLAELFAEVERLVWRLLTDHDYYVILEINGPNRYVQLMVDDDDSGLWCETVSDTYLGYPDCGPKYTADEVASLPRNRWDPPSGSTTDSPNWHRHLPTDTMGLPALTSQLLVSTLIDTHNLQHPGELNVKVRLK